MPSTWKCTEMPRQPVLAEGTDFGHVIYSPSTFCASRGLEAPRATSFPLAGCTCWEPKALIYYVWVSWARFPVGASFRGKVMKTKFLKTSFGALIFTLSGLLCLAPQLVKAQEATATVDGPAPDDSQDPPSRVARLSVVEGSVSLQPGGTGDWGAASKNRPLTIGDKLWTEQGARVELQAGQAALHLGGMTALSFLNLDGNITQLRLAEGALNFRVRQISEGDVYEVDTPNAAFTVTEAGAFRIDVNENGDATAITAIRGAGEIAAGGQSYTVHAGERADINGLDNNVRFATSAATQPDELDRWAQQRDQKEENSQSARYVSRDVVGYSDLDDYGTWRDEPEYGHVWVPNSVDVGWAPYSYGYWNWVGPWGWTWVDYSPWGFAPFHYGRWVRSMVAPSMVPRSLASLAAVSDSVLDLAAA